jgi:hypothetical protein
MILPGPLFWVSFGLKPGGVASSVSSRAAWQAGSGHCPLAPACTTVHVSTTPADATSATAPGSVRPARGAVLLAPGRPVPGEPGCHIALCCLGPDRRLAVPASPWSWAVCWAVRRRARSPACIPTVAPVGCAVGPRQCPWEPRLARPWASPSVPYYVGSLRLCAGQGPCTVHS